MVLLILLWGIFFVGRCLSISLYSLCFVFAVIVFVLARWDCIATYMSRRGFALFNLLVSFVSMFLESSTSYALWSGEEGQG